MTGGDNGGATLTASLPVLGTLLRCTMMDVAHTSGGWLPRVFRVVMCLMCRRWTPSALAIVLFMKARSHCLSNVCARREELCAQLLTGMFFDQSLHLNLAL